MSSLDVPLAAPARLSRRVRAGARGAGWPLFWLLVMAILVAPIALFLLVSASPALVGQGDAWLSLEGFRQALQANLGRAVLNSVSLGLVVSVAATAIGGVLAWLEARTDLWVRHALRPAVFGILLTPSYLIAMGWQRLLEPAGVLEVVGLHPGVLRDLIYGPVGVGLVLTVKGTPFAFLAISAALAGLGQQFQDAARTHGGSRLASFRIVAALIAPALWSSLAVVFAEAISDFGVASTLASASHFPVATYAIYSAVQAFPVRFEVASAVSWVLLLLILAALFVQNRALAGRSFRVLGGKTRAARRTRLGAGANGVLSALVVAYLVVALGVPALGAVSASMVTNLGTPGSHVVSLDNYVRALHNPKMYAPLVFSATIALVVATVTIAVAAVCAKKLADGGDGLSSRLLDAVLLTAVALPGIVFAAGYIFTFNLEVWNTLGLHLYGTTFLLGLAYLASSLPSTARLLSGAMTQLQGSMQDAARAHGATGLTVVATILVPLLARPLLSAWLLTFAHVILELPISQLLYAPGHPPVVVGIDQALELYDMGGATAMQVLAVGAALVVVGLASLAFRLFTPVGWRTLGKDAT